MDTENFWSSDAGHPPLTDELIALAEERLSVKLPDAFIDLLRLQNGGYTHGLAHPMSEPTSWAKDHVPLDSLFGIDPDPDSRSCSNLLETEYMTKEWGLPERQVLLCGDGHWWITLDYRKGPDPVVTWLDVECDQDIQIAPSFEKFIAGLQPDSDFDEEE